MTPKEQEIAIGELEERVDRLRNIYEQYFLGFEKLEPTVPRKDVDRRFAILRKEQIRNTAMRFRFQVVTQKFNTYSMHWIRICRQIEEGTYKRHVRKAKARFGDGAREVDRGSDRDISIDIDMGDFDSIDMDEVLAQADAAAGSYERAAPDTVPPPASVRPGPDRAARGAALPPGAKPLVLRKRNDTEAPPSSRAVPAALPASQRNVPIDPTPSQPQPHSQPQSQPQPPSHPQSQRTAVQGAPHSAPRLRPMNPAVRPPAPSASGIEAGAPAPRIPAPSTPSIESAPARPVGPRIVRSPQAPGQAGPPAAGRIPVAAPASAPGGAGSVPRVPVAPPAGQSSQGRMPVAPGSAPSAPNMPVGRPAPAAPGSGGRMAAPPPYRPAGAPSAPGTRAVPPVPPSVPKLPPTSLPRPVPVVPRAPMPSVSDQDAPASDPRPRAPLPLPSQVARPTKKE